MTTRKNKFKLKRELRELMVPIGMVYPEVVSDKLINKFKKKGVKNV